MKKLIMLLIASILVLNLAGCGSSPASAAELKSDKPRDTSPDATQSELAALVDGNTAFAFALYQALKAEDGNLFYSPHSISEALAMTYAGARGNTEKEMAETLQFKLAQARLHTAFNALDMELEKRGEGAKGKDEEGFRLNVVNAIWGQKDLPFQDEFLDVLAQNYGAGLRILDFVNSAEPSRQIINNWVYDQTEERIKDLLPEGSIDSRTRLVLTNAIYFNAAWAIPFNEDATSEGKFNLIDGTQVTIPFMHQSESLRYASGENYQAVDLPYDGNELSMTILLPKEGQFTDFENSLDSQTVKNIVADLSHQQVDLSLPKFKVESEFSLNDTLMGMGMRDAFGNADFPGMDGKKDLYISDVVHKSFVDVDEAGTEAAAATGVVMRLTSMPVDVVSMTVDHPFIFLIRDIQTGAVLFVGRVMNPA